MSLIIPEHYETYRVIGIDPGLTFTGVAVFELACRTSQLLSVSAFTIKTEKLSGFSYIDTDLYKDRVVKLYRLKDAVRDIVVASKPTAVIAESPFYSSFRPTAYGSLVETLSYIRAGVLEGDNNVHFSTIEPLLIKKMIGAGAKKGKGDVTRAVASTDVIMKVLREDITLLDEHSIDAIAIAYSHLRISGVI